jgi:hypothetical protein
VSYFLQLVLPLLWRMIVYEELNDPSNGLNIGHTNRVSRQLQLQVLKSIQGASV